MFLSVLAMIFPISQGIRPQSLEKVETPEIKEIIDQCTKLNKEERPSIKQLLQHEIFAEDTGFKLEIRDREVLVETGAKIISFRLRVTDQRKRREKPAHKENEAIEFEFNLENDECTELTNNMVMCSTTLFQKCFSNV